LDWTTGLPQTGVNVIRAGVATFINSTGVIELALENTQRVDWTGGSAAMLQEEGKTNFLLNSLIDGTNLATQSVTVTAAAHTLSFYGTGTVDLTGTHTATVVGAGAYPTRTTLTFTPTAGSLTLTVTGDVKFANLELGLLATSFIPTAGTAVARASDVIQVTGTNFSSWFNASEGTFVFEGSLYAFEVGKSHLSVRSDASNYMRIRTSPSGSTEVRLEAAVAGSTVVSLTPATINIANFSEAFAYKQDNYAVAVGRGTVLTDTSGNVPVVNAMFIGATVAGITQYNGRIQKILYYPQRLTNAEVQALSR
jgi:hypothetical protein